MHAHVVRKDCPSCIPPASRHWPGWAAERIMYLAVSVCVSLDSASAP